ncbi:MAG TPA: hypothetical protein PKA64_25550, partial [Myxococcota bacterium]|nr:hypothetical protein [Myxococcota bacterium]
MIILSLLAACASSAAVLPAPSPPPTGDLHLWVDPLLQGRSTHLYATGAAPNQPVWFTASTRGEGAGPCRAGLCLDLLQPRVLGSARADADGVATLEVRVPTGATSPMYLQAAAWAPDGVTQV